MEPKQNYLAVGAFVVAVAVFLLAFTVWLADLNKQGDTHPYQTFVKESVNGLAIGSLVKYRGVEVGNVTDIEISRKDPANIHIMMKIKDGTPITIGTVAVLQMQGITGVSYIELRGAVANGDLLQAKDDNEIPVIPSAPSEFRQIVDTVPDMLQKFTELANKMGQFANTENQQRVTSILTNLDNFSQQVGSQNENGKTLAQDMQQTVAEIKQTAATINQTVTGSRSDLQRILKNSSIALDKVTALTDSTKDISQQGYKDLREVQIEIKKTARELQDLSRELKENPSKVIIPPQSGGVHVN